MQYTFSAGREINTEMIWIGFLTYKQQPLLAINNSGVQKYQWEIFLMFPLA